MMKEPGSSCSSIFGGSAGKTNEPTDKKVSEFDAFKQHLEQLAKLYDQDPGRAIQVALQYSPEDIAHGDEMLTKLNYPGTPESGPSRLEQAITVLELDRKTSGEIKEMADYWCKIPLSIQGLQEVVDAVYPHEKRHWYFLRDNILDSFHRILEKYGVDATEADVQFFGGRIYGEPKVLRGFSVKEALDALDPKSNEANQLLNQRILEGFDDWKIALWHAKNRTENQREYLRLGLTSMEAAQNCSQDDVNKVFDVFGRKAKEFIQADLLLFKYLVEQAAIPQMKEYFRAAGEDFSLLETVLGAQPRPSPEAMRYVREMYKLTDPGEILSKACVIDTPHVELFSVKTDNAVEFTVLSFAYDQAKEKYRVQTGKEKYSLCLHEFLQTYPGDVRFFRYADPLNWEGKTTREFERIQAIESKMGFDAFEQLGEIERKVELIAALLNAGYDADDIRTVIEKKVSSGVVTNYVSKLQEPHMPVDDLIALVQTSWETTPDTVNEYAPVLGEDKFPHSLIPVFAENKMKPHHLASFLNLVGLERYWTVSRHAETRFDVIRFVNDYNVMFNRQPRQAEKPATT
ncbi:MAG: hypothetical protein V1743_01460 [Nanoarchaeota archaeon]